MPVLIRYLENYSEEKDAEIEVFKREAAEHKREAAEQLNMLLKFIHITVLRVNGELQTVDVKKNALLAELKEIKKILTTSHLINAFDKKLKELNIIIDDVDEEKRICTKNMQSSNPDPPSVSASETPAVLNASAQNPTLQSSSTVNEADHEPNLPEHFAELAVIDCEGHVSADRVMSEDKMDDETDEEFEKRSLVRNNKRKLISGKPAQSTQLAVTYNFRKERKAVVPSKQIKG